MSTSPLRSQVAAAPQLSAARILNAVRVPAATAGAAIALIVIANLLGFDTPGYVVALGAVVGISYGLLGICLALIFRVSRVVNFAQAAVGLFAMSFMPALIQVLFLPWWVAFAAALPIGFGAGALIETVVMRRLLAAPRVVGVVALLGVAGTLASSTNFVSNFAGGIPAPLGDPPGLPSLTVGPLTVSPGYVGLIVSAPIMTVLLALFLTGSRFGLAIRAAASNPDNARLSGISPGLVSALAWGIAGVVSTVTTVFFIGEVPADATQTVLGSSTFLPALAAAAVGGFRNFPRALVGGVIVGIVQQIMLWSPSLSRYSDLAIVGVLLVGLVFGRRALERGDRVGSWTAVSPWRPLPESLARLWLVRHWGRVLVLLVTAYLIYGATRDDVTAARWTTIVCVTVLALTTTVITGVAGELSLGQFGFAVLGAGTSFVIVRDTGDFALGVMAAGLVAGLVSVLIAYAGLRSRGLTLTILTLGFASAIPSALLQDGHVLGQGIAVPQQPVLGALIIHAGRPYFILAAVIGIVCALVCWNVWRGGFGRLARAARDNEPAAASFGVAVLATRTKIFLVTGVIAGVIGAVLIHSYTTASITSFPTDINIRVVLAVVMGGLSIFVGGPLGVLWLFASAVAQKSSTPGGADHAASATLAIYSSVLILIVIAPGGAAQLLSPVRDVIAVGIGRLFGVRCTLAELRGERRLENSSDGPGGHPASITTAPEPRTAGRSDGLQDAVDVDAAVEVVGVAGGRRLPALRTNPRPVMEDGTPLLVCHDLALRFGAVTAVDGLDLTVEKGEILGLIGANGAGKTSTFELIGGFYRPTSGRVIFDGRDVTSVPAHRRARSGLVRSFQDAQLFPTMTAAEVIELALERQRATNTTMSVLGIDLTARRRHTIATEVVEFFGLGAYRESRISELSTGTRRFVEIAALICMQPRLLLLDEPSSGIAQRESEALGPLLHRLRDNFDLTMIIIEHDVPLVFSLADRVLAMAEGRQLALGTPAEVGTDQRVIDAYLGTSQAVLERSNQRPRPSEPQPTMS